MKVKKTWVSKEAVVSKEFIDMCSSDRVLAVLLKNRGIDTKEKIDAFLNPLKRKLISPDVFLDMTKAVERIKNAIDLQENIIVYGDFDADGITSTAILYLTLQKIGAKVDYYLPDRATESHGLNTKALVNLIAKRKSKLIITVDCGISNCQEVKFAKGFNADVIITDHHEAQEELPDAFAILNPKAPDSLNPNLSFEEIQSLGYLAGVGVVFKLCCKLLESYNCEDFVHEILPLVAIGTVGDVVELIGENRSLVAMGIELIKSGRHKGVQKLIEAIGLSDKKSLTSENIAFGIVPRINASGRLDSPLIALNLLVSADEEVLNETIKKLNDLNAFRQQLCDDTFKQAQLMYEKEKSSNKKSIVLFNQDWHVGIIGIVASKLVETYNKPVFLMTKDAINKNIIRCSCRSIIGINIFDILSNHKELFAGFGGHKMAAGFSFDENIVKFDEFKTALNKTIDENTKEVDFSCVNVFADMVVEASEITNETVESLSKLQPFGNGNEAPLFIMNNLSLKEYRMMGQESNHLRLLGSQNGLTVECVKWNTPDFNLPDGAILDILFVPQMNEFNGTKKIQYLLSDIHSELINQEKYLSEIKILDHRNKKDILNQVIDFLGSTKKKTCIYIQNPKLRKQVEKSDIATQIAFSLDDIPVEKEQLMLFEAPISKESFMSIIKTTGASIIHLFNFLPDSQNIDSLISNLSGMLKYSVNNFEGKISVNRLEKALGVDSETVLNMLSMFDEVEMIELDQISNDEYLIKSLNPVELSKIKQSSLYLLIDDQIQEINKFKDFYINSDVNEIKEILS